MKRAAPVFFFVVIAVAATGSWVLADDRSAAPDAAASVSNMRAASGSAAPTDSRLKSLDKYLPNQDAPQRAALSASKTPTPQQRIPQRTPGPVQPMPLAPVLTLPALPPLPSMTTKQARAMSTAEWVVSANQKLDEMERYNSKIEANLRTFEDECGLFRDLNSENHCIKAIQEAIAAN